MAKTRASAVHGIFCASSCPEGAQQISPGQSAAPPWVTVTPNSQCPERAQHGSANVAPSLVVPFQGVRFFVSPTPRAALRGERRFALPWAEMLCPFRAKSSFGRLADAMVVPGNFTRSNSKPHGSDPRSTLAQTQSLDQLKSCTLSRYSGERGGVG